MANFLQQKAVDIALMGHNLLLQGSAGTGKSYVVSEIVKGLMTSGKKVQVTCSTGIACAVYDRSLHACTLHKYLGLQDGRHGPEDIQAVVRNTKVHWVLKELDTLIVDECSMISERTFTMMERVCRLRNEEEVFGGLQVILCGDFYQLPPVGNVLYNDSGTFCFNAPFFKEVFPHTVVLEDNHRTQDPELAQAVSEVFAGVITPGSEGFLKGLSRPLPESVPGLKLFARNDLADDYNRSKLLSFPGQLYEFSSCDSGDAQRIQTITAPKTLWVKAGCPVVLLQNLTSQLFNGRRGVVDNIDNGIGVRFDGIDHIVCVPKVKFTVFDPSLHKDIAEREQYPLKLAFGLTIHKAQGMTLDRVEVDCKDIFRPGQLGVALSRARHSSGLRVINYHPRYVMKPAESVVDFMHQPSTELQSDGNCCRKQQRCVSSEEGASLGSSAMEESLSGHSGDSPRRSTVEESKSSGAVGSSSLTEDHQDNLDLDIDDEFDEILSTMITEEEKTSEFQLPDEFSLNKLKDSLRINKEVTESHVHINQILTDLDNISLTVFVKKIVLKMTGFSASISDSDVQKGVAEKDILKFYQLVHNYSLSSDYKMNCLILFEKEGSFTGDHLVVCYKILESVRLFYIQKKVELLTVSSGRMHKRFVTDVSKSRIRYVAGYCIASLRKKYVQMQKTNMFHTSAEAQDKYHESKCKVKILNVLKESEQFLKETTSAPESLLDVERRQTQTGGLTNVSDDVFNFFVCLTDRSLGLLTNETLMKHGKNMYQECRQQLSNDKQLFEDYCHIIAMRQADENITEFSADIDENLESYVDNIVFQSVKINEVYMELLEKYLHVFLGQFRRDVLSARKVEKKMAHRKQIKVSSKQTKRSKTLSPTEPTPGTSDTSKKQTSKRKTKQRGSSPSPTDDEPTPGTSGKAKKKPSQQKSNECKSSPSPTDDEPTPGTSGLVQACTEETIEPLPSAVAAPAAVEDEEKCKKCLADKDDVWIQCDSCNGWFHRKCAGLSNTKQWRKFTRKGVQWFCHDCK